MVRLERSAPARAPAGGAVTAHACAIPWYSNWDMVKGGTDQATGHHVILYVTFFFAYTSLQMRVYFSAAFGRLWGPFSLS